MRSGWEEGQEWEGGGSVGIKEEEGRRVEMGRKGRSRKKSQRRPQEPAPSTDAG